MRRKLPTGKSIWAVCAVCLFVLAGRAGALEVAVPYVKADFMWAQGYSGDGVEIGIIDLFLADGNHPALAGNYLGYEKVVTGATTISQHATAVTGAAVSQDGTYKGTAPGAGFWTVQSIKFRGPRQVGDLRDQTKAAETLAQGLGNLAGNPVDVITISIGMPDNPTDGADHWSLGLDHIIQTNGQTITVAAGNDGLGGSIDSGLPTGAYNVITVGATGDTNGTPSEDYSRIASYSTTGPTADGRSKPDIVAPGSWIRVPILNSEWGDFYGTSLSTPIVAGGAVLLIDMGMDLGYSTDPKVIKSVLLNSADKLSGWSHTSTQPLDWNQGAGQLNLENAYYQYLDGEQDPGTVPGIGWDEQEVTWETENLYAIDGYVASGEVISAMLNWNRVVNTDSEDIDDVIYTPEELDNLELYLYELGDLSTPVASSVSSIDNVEHIYYSVAQAGSYVLGVKMSGALLGESQTYGLAWNVPTALPGDVDASGYVGGADLTTIITNWGMSGASREQGDLSGDGTVGGTDYTEVITYWGTGTAPPEPGAIPEPATLGLLLGGGLALLMRKKY